MARKAGFPGRRLPETCRPADIESATVIQRRVGVLLGQDIGGWKCSMPSEAKPAPAAPIFTSTIVWKAPGKVTTVAPMIKIEPEIAFVVGRDLNARETPYTEAEIKAVIGSTRLALEVLGTRYTDPDSVSWPEMIADSIQNQGLFVGPEFPGGMNASLEKFPVTVHAQGDVLCERDGHHNDGHPLRPLYWLANFLAARGEGLRVGQVVTTGSYAGAIEVPLGFALTVTFGDLGTIKAEFLRAF